MTESVVLLPTYNEVENLPRVLSRLARVSETDVLVIDDDSPDGTGRIAEELRHFYPHLGVLHRKRREGLGRAYVFGFKKALSHGYRRVVTMDADLSHDPDDVPRLLHALSYSEVAIGSRHVPGGGVERWPYRRRLLSRLGSLYARSLLTLRASDVTSGFRAYRAEALSRIDLDSVNAKGFVFQIEILARLCRLPGARVTEVPIRFRNRRAGVSKLSFFVVWEALLRVWILRRKFHSTLSAPAAPLSRSVFPRRSGSKPRISVVVAARPGSGEPRAVEFLRECDRKAEIIVARGFSPSRQRNAAVREASGKYVLFLDDDSEPAPNLLDFYTSVLDSEPAVAAVGGPSLSLGRNSLERAGASLLGEPLVMGKSAARYRALGSVKTAGERGMSSFPLFFFSFEKTERQP